MTWHPTPSQPVSSKHPGFDDWLSRLWKRIKGTDAKRFDSITVGASPFTYTNQYDYDVEVAVDTLSGGGVLSNVIMTFYTGNGAATSIVIYLNPAGAANTATGLIRLSSGDSLIISYTGAAPTVRVLLR